MSWYLTVLKKYASFGGRARRKEYWMFVLFQIIVMGLLLTIATVSEVEALMYLYIAYYLGTLLPTIAVIVRRLHDQGKSGGWFFIGLVPLIGGIWLLALLCTPGTVGANNYGPDPKTA